MKPQAAIFVVLGLVCSSSALADKLTPTKAFDLDTIVRHGSITPPIPYERIKVTARPGTRLSYVASATSASDVKKIDRRHFHRLEGHLNAEGTAVVFELRQDAVYLHHQAKKAFAVRSVNYPYIPGRVGGGFMVPTY
jgi:hypothetical protein